MGCILSEVITWVTEGRKKLREYRRRRLEEVGQTFATSEDRFHCNGDVLATVNQLHDELTQNARKHDYVTPTVVQGLIHNAIIVDHQSRASARQLAYHSSRILREAQKKLDRGPSSGSAPNSYQTIPDAVSPVRRQRLPPNFPPQFNLPLPTEIADADTDISNLGQGSQPPMPPNGFQEQDYYDTTVQNVTVQGSLPNSINRNNHSNGVMPERFFVPYQEQHVAPLRLDRISTQPVSYSTNPYNCNRLSAHTGRIAEFSLENNSLGIIAHASDSTRNSQVPYRPRQPRQSPTVTGTLAPKPSTTGSTPQLPEFRGSDPFIYSETAHLPPVNPGAYTESSFSREPERNNRPHPQMSVQSGLDIKRARERGQNARYPDQDLFQTSDAVLRKRDHVRRSSSF